MACEFCKRDRRVVGRGLCAACYQRWRKAGTPEYQRWGLKKVCQIDGCDGIVAARGLCEKHYQRLWKHGHTEDTRPDSWGARSKHPLSHTWKWLLRKRGIQNIALEWRGDFLQFAMDVGERPSPKHKLFAADEAKLIGPGNFVWKRAITERAEGEDEQTFRNRRARVYRAVQQESFKGYDLKRFYGITHEEYEALLIAQGGKCAICCGEEVNQFRGRPFSLSVDHCHSSGRIRGLLCSSCNTGLGSFKDDPEILRRAIAYLERYGDKKAA